MARKQKKTETRAKKKRWVTLISPKVFGEQVIGETYVDDPLKVKGKCISLNLMNLTGDPKKQSINVKFLVTALDGGKAMTECVSYEMIHSSVKRVVRRNRERIDDSFTVLLACGRTVRVKPFILTRFKTNNSVTQAIRKAAKEEILSTFRKKTFDSIIQELSINKLQSKLKEKLKKIYPLNLVEIRKILVLKKGDAPVQIEEEIEASVEEEKKPKEDSEAESEEDTSDEAEEPEEETTDEDVEDSEDTPEEDTKEAAEEPKVEEAKEDLAEEDTEESKEPEEESSEEKDKK